MGNDMGLVGGVILVSSWLGTHGTEMIQYFIQGNELAQERSPETTLLTLNSGNEIETIKDLSTGTGDQSYKL